MKTVPSLIASSTVGIAAAGLVLGKPERSSPLRPSSRKRKAGNTPEVIVHQDHASPLSRPGTSSTLITPETKTTPPKIRSTSAPNPPPSNHQRFTSTRNDTIHSSRGRRHSFFWQGEAPSAHELLDDDVKRESVSSRGSWIRRLSTIPNSLNNSPRSSIGPDSPSVNISQSSAVPILSNLASSPAQLPPNKLVKRNTSVMASQGTISRRGTTVQVPTLRRPATSRQRSITLQQQFQDDSMIAKDPLQRTPSSQAHSTHASKFSTPESRHAWRFYFDSRPTKLTKERSSSGRSSDEGIQDFHSSSRRVLPDDTATPTLVKPAMIPISKSSPVQYYEENSLGYETSDERDMLAETALPSVEPREESQKRPRRTMSLHFSSPTSWISRSGSLRGGNKNAEVGGGGKRYASAPLPTLPGRSISTAHGPVSSRQRTMDQNVFSKQPLSPMEISGSNDSFTKGIQTRPRNTSSPLPPLSRLSSFNIDLARLGLSSSSSAALRSPGSPVVHTNTGSVASTGHVSPSSALYISTGNSKRPRTSEIADRASTLVGSDNETKGFTSGDEDDMDFQSETLYDSLRSGATGSTRSHNAPLDSMFDESPPSLNGHKNKRLSIHEMLNNGGFQELNDRIVEEDEGMPTPVKPAKHSHDEFHTPVRDHTVKLDKDFPSSPPSFCLATKDFGREFGRPSIDDEDDDEDWTRDDENMEIRNQLSPPSNNSRRVSPTLRAALADVTHNGATNATYVPSAERPKSNLFDWSEPSTEKNDFTGASQRPKTAHVTQLADGRGGRAIGRRGPNALHVRSQSVPVVADATGQRDSKLTPKFGTWGLGAKGVSEDWDGDFDFDTNDENEAEVGEHVEMSGMLVPQAIKESQANVVGHVGQIREVCLLVEDLKRLRLLAKEKGLLTGPSAPLWKEAEGIIALAVPDEEDLTLSPPHSPLSPTFEHRGEFEEKYYDHGPDAEDVSRPEAPFEVLNRHGHPSGFIYDGSTIRRRTVLSTDDDIFGAGALHNPPSREHLRPPSNSSPRHSSLRSVKSSEVARSVMETMHQHRSTSDPLLQKLTSQSPNKMPFDTTSLRDLVHRANVLSRTLGDLIRKADGSRSPEVSPHRDSSPAFTRVFTDPMQSPPKHLPRSQSNNSILSGSIDSSPTRKLGKRMHMMTVV